jgi:hypothetical protein
MTRNYWKQYLYLCVRLGRASRSRKDQFYFLEPEKDKSGTRDVVITVDDDDDDNDE